MPFYQHDPSAMRAPGDGMAMPGVAPVDKFGEAEPMGLAPPDPALNVPPEARLSTYIQQYSRSPAQFQRQFWRHQMDLVENGFDSEGKPIDFFNLGSATSGSGSALPLARIKKVMKNDDEVKMISAEAPILFSRACEIFIADLTCRAFMVAEENKRRTIQRSDIANAIARSDLFDFLIDIVPRSDMVRNRGASVPIRNAMTAPTLPATFAGADAATAAAAAAAAASTPRVPMNDAQAPFMPLRSTQPDVRGRMETMDSALGMGATQPLKGMPKPSMGGEWAPGMYPFQPAPPMGDARLHPGAGLGLGAPSPNAARVPVMGRGGNVDAGFMDGAPLSMGGAPSRTSLMNMVPYSMDDHGAKTDGAAGES